MEALGAGLAGKGVIVTGAAGGIGSAVAQKFARNDARLLVTDVNQEGVDRILGLLSGEGHDGMVCDLCDASAREALVARALEQFGSIRALAHVAGIYRPKPTIMDHTEKDWDDQLDTNLKASFFLARSVAEEMKKAGEKGSVIAFASGAWWTGGVAGSMIYAASKGGLVSVFRGLARTYGPDGITFNTLAPGLVDTEMIAKIDPATREGVLRGIPMSRVSTPEEMAGIVVFLASDHARYITGATVNITGGQIMY